MGFAVHRMPQIGEVQPGVWLTTGFGGQGINTSAIAGQLIARAIIESDATWQTFLPYELVWAGGVAGRVVTQAMLSWWHASEAISANLARRREALHQRRQREEAGDEPLELVRRPAYRVVKASRRMIAERLPARPSSDAADRRARRPAAVSARRGAGWPGAGAGFGRGGVGSARYSLRPHPEERALRASRRMATGRSACGHPSRRRAAHGSSG